jgi:hypothetical protein
MQKITLKKTLVCIVCAAFPFVQGKAQPFAENFDDISSLAGNDWIITNNSAPVGITSWFQGYPVSAAGPFNAYNGADYSYVAANYNSTGNSGNISNWLLMPNRTFRNGDVLTFATRKVSPDTNPDRLEVRLSTSGTSTSVGSTATSTGDFTSLLLTINPALETNIYPTTWTTYTVTIAGLPGPISGRLAFRYHVTNGGASGANSDYIGIDNVTYTPYVCPAITMTPAGALTEGATGAAYSYELSQTGALGTAEFALTAGALPAGLTISSLGTISGIPTATGTFNFTVTVSDASACSGSENYTITTVCGTDLASLNGLPEPCADDAPLTLTQGSPAGGTYAGTGVSGGIFDPAAGTQTITYEYTDPNGCFFTTSATITVNTPPTATQTAIADVCFSAPAFELTGGSPEGGDYTGTGVTAGSFNPMVGSQTLTYTYTDANGCAGNADFDITVLDPTELTFTLPVDELCIYNSPLELSGGMPAGGTYTGTAVTDGAFNPATAGLGNHTIVYTYTDANNCGGLIMDVVTVEECLGLAENTQKLLQAYPNPGTGLFIIKTEQGQELTGIQVFDIQGKQVQNAVLTDGLSVKVDLTQANKGMYFLQGMLNGNPVSIKLVKE